MIPALIALLFGGALAPTVLDPTRRVLNARTARLEAEADRLAAALTDARYDMKDRT